jgi:hypothetical protein
LSGALLIISSVCRKSFPKRKSFMTRSFASLILPIFVLAAGTPNIVANVTFLSGYADTDVEDNSANDLAYQADVSNSDLLNGVTPSSFTTSPTFPTVGAWNTANNASVPALNDGIHGLSFAAAGNTVQGAWPNRLATVTYTLGLGANNLGHDISSIRSIAAWNGEGFGNQAWTLAVQHAGGGSFVDVATVNYQPLSTGGSTPGATKVTLSNLNITGIQALKVTTISVNGGANGGAFVWRELDAVGTPTPSVPDTNPPLVSTLSPADGSGNVAVGGNLVATFNENIALGTGNITIKNLDNPAQTQVISLPNAQVAVSGAVLTINPNADLSSGSHYAVQIDAIAIADSAGNSFVGISNDTTWDFTTGVPDLTAPSLMTLRPVDNATSVPLASDLVATFNEKIALGNGTITIKDLDTPSQSIITLPDARVSVADSVLTFNPSTNLSATKHYAVQISSGAITDLSGNPFADINDDTHWDFTTADAPLRIMCLGDSITAGYTNNPTWNVPFMFGYRSGLYTHFPNAAYNFLFVGGSAEPWNNAFGDPSRGGTYKPALATCATSAKTATAAMAVPPQAPCSPTSSVG